MKIIDAFLDGLVLEEGDRVVLLDALPNRLDFLFYHQLLIYFILVLSACQLSAWKVRRVWQGCR